MRAFSGEIIKIMRDQNYIHIGLQGDCVYGVFSTSKQEHIAKIFSMAVKVNSFIIMLNKILQQNNFTPIKVGIGLSTGNDLIIKVGADNTGINDVLFIGNAVADAWNNSSLAKKDINEAIVACGIFYKNLDNDDKKLLSREYTVHAGKVHAGDVVNTAMNDWTNNNFKD